MTAWKYSSVRYARLYSGDDGISHFEDLELHFAPQEFAPPAPSVDVSEPVKASAFMMLSMPAGWTDAAHPAPARQFALAVRGRFEISAGGETRVFSPGDVLFVEDTSGSGHSFTVIDDALIAIVRL